MTKYYAGIGPRENVPPEMLNLMTELSKALNRKGYVLRSGGAKGCDTAFEKGAGSRKEILRPKHATPETIKMAMELHPAPQNCNEYVQKLHGRNVQIILGPKLDTPVLFVICYTKNENYGGTSMGIKVARLNKIKVLNLWNKEDLKKVKEQILKEN